MASRFYRRTVVSDIELMEAMSHAELTRCLVKWGPDYVGRGSWSIPKTRESVPFELFHVQEL